MVDRLYSTRWLLIFIFFCITLISAFWTSHLALAILPLVSVLTIFLATFMHGKMRYNLKSIFIFFMITWLVSHFFEACSIQTGFPFGHYYYDQLAGPRLFAVPFIIMFAYFAMGYASWTLAQIILRLKVNRLIGRNIFYVPLIASFIMVMWDICVDPIASTVHSFWVWQNGGVYFGVPLQNYAGWFLVVYIIFQLFAFYIAKFENKNAMILRKKTFWLQPVAIYGIQGFSHILLAITANNYFNLYYSIALLTVFTMGFVTILALITLTLET